MSTYLGVFENLSQARELVRNLLRAGVGPDDVSLISREGGADWAMELEALGDATAFVGRADALLQPGPEVTDNTSAIASPISGIDTSNKGTNVDSIDQADDSQALAEDSLDPYEGITQGEHETDDLVLATETGFPTAVPLLDDVIDSETGVQESYDTDMLSLSMPGVGTVIGGGSLATALLEFDVTDAEDSLTRYLVDRGVPPARAKDYCRAFSLGKSLLGVEIVPGAISEAAVEDYASSAGIVDGELYDAPRFHDATREDATLQ